MHRAVLSWELLGPVGCPSYTRLNYPAVPASTAAYTGWDLQQQHTGCGGVDDDQL